MAESGQPKLDGIETMTGSNKDAGRTRDDHFMTRVSFEQLLTAIDAAKLLNIHPVTLLRWSRGGRVPHLRLGRRVMFRASELDAWCRAGYTDSAVRAA
jgi:excisionase family DNA binding protein